MRFIVTLGGELSPEGTDCSRKVLLLSRRCLLCPHSSVSATFDESEGLEGGLGGGVGSVVLINASSKV